MTESAGVRLRNPEQEGRLRLSGAINHASAVSKGGWTPPGRHAIISILCEGRPAGTWSDEEWLARVEETLEWKSGRWNAELRRGLLEYPWSPYPCLVYDEVDKTFSLVYREV